MKLTDIEKGRIIRLHKEGWNTFEIADLMNLPEATVRQFLFKYLYQ